MERKILVVSFNMHFNINIRDAMYTNVHIGHIFIFLLQVYTGYSLSIIH